MYDVIGLVPWWWTQQLSLNVIHSKESHIFYTFKLLTQVSLKILTHNPFQGTV